MANSRYYYQNSPQYGSSSYNQVPTLPIHLCFFLVILLLFMGISWYMSYESAFESVMEQLKLMLILSPLVLLLAVHWLSQRSPELLIPLPEKESFHRAGGSPWGVAFVLVLLMFMISYQSYFQERWFPLLSR
ncbi:uncharacterized protein LOC120262960 [Dioscorea cayenensis subsp. rotundata]|uniref:Uncharacterized protein LOC120262960 n=1 Tax=Dioscorea cayennensis subsp. rotundata TaxID=55577 RepID=A0AB40BHL8_DIOCR|nr:uncharacterized protein LOC120262960 [Dioscorea cayenensis subsp. rotundata]